MISVAQFFFFREQDLVIRWRMLFWRDNTEVTLKCCFVLECTRVHMNDNLHCQFGIAQGWSATIPCTWVFCFCLLPIVCGLVAGITTFLVDCVCKALQP